MTVTATTPAPPVAPAAAAAAGRPAPAAPPLGSELVGRTLARGSDRYRNDVIIGAAKVLDGPANGYASVEDALAALKADPPKEASKIKERGLYEQHFPVIVAKAGDRYVNLLGDKPTFTIHGYASEIDADMAADGPMGKAYASTNMMGIDYVRTRDKRVAAVAAAYGRPYENRGRDNVFTRAIDKIKGLPDEFLSGPF